MSSISKPKIKAVFLDIGGVVLRIDWRRAFSELGLTNPLEQFKQINRFESWSVHHEYERGNISSETFLREVIAFFDFDGTMLDAERAWQNLIAGPLPGVEEIFDRFSKRVVFHTLSNTNKLHFDIFSAEEPVFRHFDQLFTSFKLRVRKPDLAIFEKAAAEVGLSPSACLFIDDGQENIDAARRAGFNAELSVNSVEWTIEILEKYLWFCGAKTNYIRL